MIAIIDYGLGNIRAFANVYKRLNIDCVMAGTPEQLEGASKLILPGVGAFDHAMTTLNNSGMREIVDKKVLEEGLPVLGICVGMQMMAKRSDEGELPGLGWIDGEVKHIEIPSDVDAARYPLPHMGWNSLTLNDEAHPLFKDMEQDPRFYFLHSYYFSANAEDATLATAKYGNQFSCIVHRDRIFGVQCHPEKSHHNGVALLKNFAEL